MKNSRIHRLEQAEATKKGPYALERNQWKQGFVMCGVDEAGRGCLAGPVVVAAAILQKNVRHQLLIDSKKLSPQQLEFMYNWLQTRCLFTVSIASARIIDQHNIYQTTAKYMRQALLHILSIAPELPKLIAIDAMPLQLFATPYQDIEIQSFIKGESRSASIAAASIIAKVTRDRIMKRLETTFPGYGLEAHKGYCTKQHQENIRKLKPAIIHRTSYLTWLKKDQLHDQQTIFC
jgi:ribonuclease HII